VNKSKETSGNKNKVGYTQSPVDKAEGFMVLETAFRGEQRMNSSVASGIFLLCRWHSDFLR
jgi:hypothetical protein